MAAGSRSVGRPGHHQPAARALLRTMHHALLLIPTCIYTWRAGRSPSRSLPCIRREWTTDDDVRVASIAQRHTLPGARAGGRPIAHSTNGGVNGAWRAHTLPLARARVEPTHAHLVSRPPRRGRVHPDGLGAGGARLVLRRRRGERRGRQRKATAWHGRWWQRQRAASASRASGRVRLNVWRWGGQGRRGQRRQARRSWRGCWRWQRCWRRRLRGDLLPLPFLPILSEASAGREGRGRLQVHLRGRCARRRRLGPARRRGHRDGRRRRHRRR